MTLPSADVPLYLRPYVSHGVDLNWSNGDERAVGDCPFCGMEGKFSVEITTGIYKCWRPGCPGLSDKGNGNAYVFLRKLHALSLEATERREYLALAADRKLLYGDTLLEAQLCQSLIDGSWLIPGWNLKGKIHTLYRYEFDTTEQRFLCKPTWGMKPGHGLFGYNLYNPKCNTVYLLEGIWDMLQFYEVLATAKQDDINGDAVSLSETGNRSASLIATSGVLAVPTASVWQEDWCALFAGKTAVLLPQNDHPKEYDGRHIEPASQNWFRHIAQELKHSAKPPKQILWHPWKEWYDPDLPSGYDYRDLLTTV